MILTFSFYSKKVNKKFISGWQDLNLRLSAPKADTLPNCVTSRLYAYYSIRCFKKFQVNKTNLQKKCLIVIVKRNKMSELNDVKKKNK